MLRRRITLITAAVVALGVVLPGVAQAAPPSNDDFDASTTVAELPYTAQLDTAEATRAADDPLWCQYFAIGGTVWFSYTATEDQMLRATTAGSNHQTILSAYTGERGTDLLPEGDACDISGNNGATVTFKAHAGTTYHFMVAGYNIPGGALSFGLQPVTPAANDDFAGAEQLTGLPSTRDIDLSVASTEYDEPASNCGAGVDRSVWYSFTATETESLTAKVEDSSSTVEVYTGNSLPELQLVACARGGFSDPALFRATAGTTYYLRVGSRASTDATTLTLAEAPALRPYFSTSPYDPTIYEMTHFTGETGEFGTPIASGQWDFGDGTVAPANGSGVDHHYTADGTYQVRLDVVSPDGRTGTFTSAVTVETHDVSIGKFVTPAKARTGETKQITVHVANTRYRESGVTVRLLRSDGQFWREVGTITLDVPAHPTRMVKVPFSYTFTAADAVVGKVAFRAEVDLPYPVRDARMLDNMLISTPTTVQPGVKALRYA